MATMQMHSDQLSIEPGQVAALIAEQLPELGGQDVVVVPGSGTVNAIFRVGGAATARFPLRDEDPDALRVALGLESAAAEEFRLVSPFPSPKQLLIGEPGHGFPLPWTVQSWLDGEIATPRSCADSVGAADDLAALIGQVRACDTHGRTFRGAGRGGRIQDHDLYVDDCISRTAGLFDTDSMRQLWAGFRTLPREDPDLMNHTDLIPGNLLVADGRLTGVLDAGGFQAADPALDLVCAWHLLDDRPREVLRAALDCSDLQWERGRAWAFQQAAGAYWYYLETNPAMADMGRTTLERLVASA